MKENILFSIIIPVFNKQDYIMECINSVLTQKYKNFEVIIVDDCSTDNSFSIISSYNYIRNIKILSNSINSGVSFSRNRGLEKATGDYIVFLDADDKFISNNLFEILYKSIVKYKFDYFVLSRNYYDKRVVPNIKKTKRMATFVEGNLYQITNKGKFLTRVGFPFGGSASACISSNLIKERKFNINELHYEDWGFLIPLFFDSKSTAILTIPMIYINYVEGSLSKERKTILKYHLPQIYYYFIEKQKFKLSKILFWYWMTSNLRNFEIVNESRSHKNEIKQLMKKNLVFNKHSVYSIVRYSINTLKFKKRNL